MNILNYNSKKVKHIASVVSHLNLAPSDDDSSGSCEATDNRM